MHAQSQYRRPLLSIVPDDVAEHDRRVAEERRALLADRRQTFALVADERRSVLRREVDRIAVAKRSHPSARCTA